jgi:hypothetical protein
LDFSLQNRWRLVGYQEYILKKEDSDNAVAAASRVIESNKFAHTPTNEKVTLSYSKQKILIEKFIRLF